MIRRIAALLLACLILGGCGLRLRLINSSVQRPSNIALYFSVQTRDGRPVAGLDAKKFRIFEDGQRISVFESKQTILNPEVAVAHYMLLLLDLSGSITRSGSLPALVEAASGFAERVGKDRQMAVYGFDGRTRVLPIARFTTDSGAIKTSLAALTKHKMRDPSTNLNGAVVQAIRMLERRMKSSSKPLRFATLVVFTDGTDRARRVTEKQMFDRLEKSSVNVFVVGMGAEVSSPSLKRLGRDGFVKAANKAQLRKAFDAVAAGIEAAGKQFYLLSYCSPARAGKHKLRVEVTFKGKSGSLEHDFNARGFGPRCNPNRRPRFSLSRVRFKK